MSLLLRKATAGMAAVVLLGGFAAWAAVDGPEIAGASSSSTPIKIGLICACFGHSWGPGHLTFHPLLRRGPTR